ncbi:MAG: chemotaxis protein CheW [Myxococcota bacterium]|nr:chemotaxis protein CheW [Myxococcota bacterium]MDW8362734.1 chemotaxis protein CheW [Myxococcales bacterium]
MTSSPRARSSRAKNFVGFVVGEVVYALDIHRVREILQPLPVVPLPHAPPVLLGVADHRGEVVPVLDLRRRFGLPPAADGDRRRKWIVVRAGTRGVALVVDAVTDVFGGEPVGSGALPALGAGDRERGIVGVQRHAGRMVFVLDVDQLAASALAAAEPSAGVAP